jgi:O-antigen ligase
VADSHTWIRCGIIALFFLAEAMAGLAWRGILPLSPKVLMMVPVAVCFLALFLLRFELGIALTVFSFLVPLSIVSFGSFSFGPMPFLVLLLFALYLATGLVKERRTVLRAPGALPLLLLVGMSLASVAYAHVAPDPHVGHGRDWSQGHWWIGYQAMGVLLFAYTWVVYVVAANGLRSQGWLWAVYLCAVAVCTYVVVAPLPAYLAGFRGFNQLFREGGRLLESASGTAAMLLAVLSLAVILYTHRWQARLLFVTLFLLALLDLFLSYFLNTWLGFLAGAAVLLLKRSRRAFLIWLMVCLLVAVLAADVLLLIREQRFSAPGQGDLRRLDIWANLVQVWLKRPVLGVGNANLPSYLLAYGTGRIPARVALLGQAHPHNTYLGILAENGLLGLGCMLWLILSFVRALWRSIDRMAADALRGLAAGSLALFVAGATTAMFAGGLLPIYSAGGAGSGNVNGMALVWILYGAGVAATRVGRCTPA